MRECVVFDFDFYKEKQIVRRRNTTKSCERKSKREKEARQERVDVIVANVIIPDYLETMKTTIITLLGNKIHFPAIFIKINIIHNRFIATKNCAQSLFLSHINTFLFTMFRHQSSNILMQQTHDTTKTTKNALGNKPTLLQMTSIACAVR